MQRWSGKVAVVTGASSGIGRAVALQLAKYGMKVVALDKNQENQDKLTEDLKGSKGCIRAYKCDVRNPQEIKAAFEFTEKNVGPPSVLINNAGVNPICSLSEANMDNARNIIETNVLGATLCIQEAIASMKRNQIDDGHIINLNSIVGHHILTSKGMGVYTASKFAVTALSESLKNELAIDKSKIKVTSVSPGLVETAMSIGALKNMESIPKLFDKDIADCIIYVLQTPKHVNISEITIQGVGECLEWWKI